MTVWEQVKGVKHISEIILKGFRIVEDQSKSTTRKFVDTAVEHDLLEKLIDASKPKIKYYGDEIYFKDLHYLLYTPFRYPPLPWGSRFGTRIERGLLYAAFDLKTAMSEKAFYKLAFFRASEGKLGAKTISYTAFKINIESDKFIDLCVDPFQTFQENISSKENYAFSQELGKKMRDDNIECFKYKSARDTEQGYNIGVLSPKALLNNNQLEKTFEHLNCYSTKEIVEFSFKHRIENAKYIFPVELFLVSGNIPLPAL